jgi:hypothetical protein
MGEISFAVMFSARNDAKFVITCYLHAIKHILMANFITNMEIKLMNSREIQNTHYDVIIYGPVSGRRVDSHSHNTVLKGYGGLGSKFLNRGQTSTVNAEKNH